jgi:DNA-binding beta-propeller fold protein YncE
LCNLAHRFVITLSDAHAPTTRVGRSPLGAALDPGTNTLYVNAFGDASESLIDTALRNATNLAGCQRVLRQVVVGSGPNSASLDPNLDTMYVSATSTGRCRSLPTGR